MPAEAVIRTGVRAVVIVRQDGASFAPREVTLGADLGDQIEVLQGLKEGDEVVTSGQFLIDSEARLKSVLGAMGAAQPVPAAAAASAPSGVHRASGKVESVDAAGITISHGPVPALQWPEMTMGFGKADAGAFAGIRPGDTVSFTFKAGGPMDWELVTVQKAGAAQ